jgi:hypothetical protein
MSQKEYDKLSTSEKSKEDWMNSKWRPMMGWMYMITCFADFVAFPVLWSLIQSLSNGQVNVQWQPITLQGAGLYHIAMGAVLGIAAYGRTQEKLNGANNGGLPTPGTTYVPPAPAQQSSFSTVPATAPAPAFGSFGQTASTNSFSQPQTFTSKQGKPGPVIEEPEL